MRLILRIAGVAALVLAAWALGHFEESPPSVLAFVLASAAGIGVLLASAGSPARPQIPALGEVDPGQVGAARATASELLQSQDSALLEALSEPAIVLDSTLKVRAANHAARDLLGKLVPREPIDLYLRQPIAIEAMRESLVRRQLVERELVLSMPIERYFVLRSNPLLDPTDPDRSAIIVTLNDVTKLRLSDRMRADFVANASHELRTPLATLIGFVETLQGPAANDRAARAKFLDIMSREAARMARLIDDLLSLSKIEMDKHVQPDTPINMLPIIRDVGSTLAMRLDADSRFIDLRLPDQLPSVIADRDQMIQVFHNLISNALKYGRTGTAIVVEAKIDRQFMRMSVEDRGDGIASEHIPRLTERFYRVDTARSRNLGGTGLGLAIVKHIVERHRGDIAIASTLGSGTRISFTIPLAQPVAGPVESPNPVA